MMMSLNDVTGSM
ncbi:hypothetical protein C5167_042378 [Papaver somniferum]|uniref:Uncharacterized protein n=1 Tax=Papaver somniferum TaxID=3469 RepID=A0A4Y7L595_PAPSO|nr:hypothetical protein C5167_042378 [Papaver somniferum]